MNVLLVGGAGYLGGAMTDLLEGSDMNLRVYDLLLYEETYRKNVPFVLGDVRERGKLTEQLEWADVVVWLAAIVGDGACALNESLTKDVNIESLRFLRDNFDGRILFLSSCSVYGAGDGILHEGSPLNPLSLYAKAKLEGEDILKDKNSISFRLGTLYGLGDAHARVRFDLVVNTLVMRAVLHKRISVFGGAQYRPHLHVFDAARVLVDQLTTSNTGVYNLHGENLTIKAISDIVKERLPETHVDILDSFFEDNRNYRASSDAARREIGFAPEFTVNQGVDELAELLTGGRVKEAFLSRYSNYLYLKPLLTQYESPLGKVMTLNA
jgi:nucleoside-diphosphate-sugar epimerase